MDAKQTALLSDLHSRFLAGNFGEIDVHSLLALLRDDSPASGPVRELGDFIAHRERDRGKVHRYLTEMKTILDRLGTQEDVLRVGVVFTDEVIAKAIDTELARHGLAALSAVRHRQIQLAILSTLQQVALVDSRGSQFGVLELSITRDLIQLLGVVTLAKPPGVRVAFPALTIPNDCFPIHAQHAHVKPTGLLNVVVRGGATILEGVKPYEIHVGRKREKGKPQPAPITWPEVEAALAGLPISGMRPAAEEFDVPAADGSDVAFILRAGRLSFGGRTEHFAVDSPVWQCALVLKHRLNARVYDDTGGYLFETIESLNTLQPE